MKDLDKFTPEERKHLSYLGSMLSKPNNAFDAEVQRIIDAGLTGKHRQVEEEDTTSGDD
jgi:hypothetical protein